MDSVAHPSTHRKELIGKNSLTRIRGARRAHRTFPTMVEPHPSGSSANYCRAANDRGPRTHDSAMRRRGRARLVSFFPFLAIARVVARGLLPLGYRRRSLVVLYRHVAFVGRDLHLPIHRSEEHTSELQSLRH